MNDTNLKHAKHDCMARIRNSAFAIRREISNLKAGADSVAAAYASILAAQSRTPDAVEALAESDPRRPSMTEMASQMGQSLRRLITCLRARGDQEQIDRLEQEYADLRTLEMEAIYLEDYGELYTEESLPF